jgi:molybdopterin molybdotransferase
MMLLAEAEAAVHAQLSLAVSQESVPLAQARGRILGQDLISPLDLPPHDNAAVDGFALSGRDLPESGTARLRLAGRAAAGRPFTGVVLKGEAARILTGAPLPAGTDTVVMQEDCAVDGDTLHVLHLPRCSSNRRRQGEDILLGKLALSAGQRLRAPEVALAAALGQTSLNVFQRLSVGLFSTGDEVRDPGILLQAGQIWDANRWMLRNLLEGLGCRVADLGILPDDVGAVERALQAAAHVHDLLITSGGMSVGSEDHLGAVIRRRGTLDIWRLAVKPGKPVGFGDIDTCPILALPGNPVAAMVLFLVLGRGIVLRLSGALLEPPLRLRLPADFVYKKRPGRREYLLGRVDSRGPGVSVVRPLPKQGTAILSATTLAEGLILLPEEAEIVDTDDLVDFLPLSSLMA